MKSNRSLSEIAAEVLAAEARGTSPPEDAARARAIGAIAKAMAERKIRERRRKWTAFAGLAAAAAAVAVVVGASWHHAGTRTEAAAVSTASSRPALSGTATASFVRGAPVILRAGTHRAVVEGTALEAGDRLIVEPGSRTTVALANGTYVLADSRADLVLVSPPPAAVFQLESGSVRADVAKLKPEERFVIRTNDAEIEVHGTSFDVSRVAPDPACGDGTTTRVDVREGVVAVRARGVEVFVHANESWPRGCAGHSQNGAAPEPSSLPAGSASNVSANPSPERRRSASASNLAAQNDQF
jgi:ferric-dicitrate binding protein FerR (iron transport regulator)